MGIFVGIFKNKTFSLVTIFVGFSMVSALAHAQYPDLTAAPWNGSASGSDFACSNPADNGPFTDQISMVFSNQVSGNFDVAVTFTEAGGSPETDTGSGFFTSASTIQFTVTNTDFGVDTTNVNGTISGNTISFTFSGSNVGGDFCSWSGNGSVSQGGGNVITPETPSSTLTEAILFNTQIQSQVSDISKHIAGSLGGRRFFGGPRVTDNQFKMEGATGLNAGDGTTIPYGVWGSYSYSDYDNDLIGTAFDGSSHSFLGGIDFAFWENTVLGVAFGYDNSGINTIFNGGHQDTDTYTIAPYFGALLSDILSLDFNIGYSHVDYDQFRTLPGTTTRVSSSPNADRWFGALNLNGVAYYGNWILGGRIGALYAKSVIDSFTESNGTVVTQRRNKVSTGSVAGDVAYSYRNFEPFLNLSYQYDFQLTEISVTTGPQPTNDRDDVLMTVGVRYYENNSVSGNLEYSKRFDRDNFDEDRVSLTVRVDF